MSDIKDDELLNQIQKLMDEIMEKYVAIKGISIGTSLAVNIYSKLNINLDGVKEQELIASATSFQYISRNLYGYVLNEKNLKSTYVTVKDYILLVLIVKDISAVFILDRSLAELEGIQKYQTELSHFVLEIAAVIETSDLMREDLFVTVKRAIPSATMIAIVSKDGMPLKVEGKNLQEAMVGSMVAALSNLTQVMLKESMDYTVLEGEEGYILVTQLNEEHILAIALPNEEIDKSGKYLARIKEIVRKNMTLVEQ